MTDDLDAAYLRVTTRVSDGLDLAACVAILAGIDRATFIETASNAYDFIRGWHQYHTGETR